MSMRRPTLLVLATLALGLTASACKDDPPTPKLFQEQGTWAVVSYDLEGNGEQRNVNEMAVRNSFLLQFDTAEKVVTAAACVEVESDTVDSSPCLIYPQDTMWYCRCFAYDFVRDEQLWREFNPGEMPPTVKLSEADGGGAADEGAGSGSGSGSGGGGGDGGGAVDGDTRIMLSEPSDAVNSTFNFRPLPEGVFGSNGENSRFVMQKRADSVFDPVFEDEVRPTCEPCVP